MSFAIRTTYKRYFTEGLKDKEETPVEETSSEDQNSDGSEKKETEQATSLSSSVDNKTKEKRELTSQQKRIIQARSSAHNSISVNKHNPKITASSDFF